MTYHNANQALMGATGSSVKEVTNLKGTIAAGLAVRLKSDGTISVASADGSLLGISLGKDLSDIGYTAICRKGLRVPVKLTSGFDPVVGAIVNLSDTTGAAIASGAGATAVNAVYASGRLGGTTATGGISETGGGVADTGVAYIDFPGGL